jgi:hypothetical protein
VLACEVGRGGVFGACFVPSGAHHRLFAGAGRPIDQSLAWPAGVREGEGEAGGEGGFEGDAPAAGAQGVPPGGDEGEADLMNMPGAPPGTPGGGGGGGHARRLGEGMPGGEVQVRPSCCLCLLWPGHSCCPILCRAAAQTEPASPFVCVRPCRPAVAQGAPRAPPEQRRQPGHARRPRRGQAPGGRGEEGARIAFLGGGLWQTGVLFVCARAGWRGLITLSLSPCPFSHHLLSSTRPHLLTTTSTPPSPAAPPFHPPLGGEPAPGQLSPGECAAARGGGRRQRVL